MKQRHTAGDGKYYTDLAKDSLRYVTEEYSRRYRVEDERRKTHISHAGKCDTLRRVSRSFNHPIDVLDLGCGTGRYFHCLGNTRRLVGVDLSMSMLALARDPVDKNAVGARIDLLCGSLFEVEFKEASFDLVCCIGVVGVFCPLDLLFLERVGSWLKPSGKFFFTTVDARSPRATSWRGIAAKRARFFLPAALKRRIDVRLKDFRISEDELRLCLGKSHFVDYAIERFFSETGRIDLNVEVTRA